MERQSAIAIVKEACAKRYIAPPLYDFVYSPKSGHICKATLLGNELYGAGATQQIAKQHAASSLLQVWASNDSTIEMDYKVYLEQIRQAAEEAEKDDKAKIVVKKEVVKKEKVEKVEDAEDSEDKKLPAEISALFDFCKLNALDTPKFLTFKIKKRNTIALDYAASVSVGIVKCFVTAANENEARNSAAEKMLGVLEQSSELRKKAVNGAYM